jgi:hypothetical protein
MAKKPEDQQAQLQEDAQSAIDALKSRPQPKPMRCREKEIVVYYRGGVLNRASAEQAIVDRLYDDGETADLLLPITGGLMPTPGVCHFTRREDTENPISEDAVKLRGLWATLDEHTRLWQEDQRERTARARRTEEAELAETNRKAKLREKVVEEAAKPGANFELIANKYSVHAADVREWVLATV